MRGSIAKNCQMQLSRDEASTLLTEVYGVAEYFYRSSTGTFNALTKGDFNISRMHVVILNRPYASYRPYYFKSLSLPICTFPWHVSLLATPTKGVDIVETPQIFPNIVAECVCSAFFGILS